ncbi:hypothetical protein EV702DRAFT_1202456 [Suillus placidus]|uniref:Uncharacterized protein n=1 Tax=Suillus placidus TaxID=48579 RepID=A0A9P7CY19_9AGAM|nr:hypothetical protein EV702DRAFT_1202456 [Suillus placidus]
MTNKQDVPKQLMKHEKWHTCLKWQQQNLEMEEPIETFPELHHHLSDLWVNVINLVTFLGNHLGDPAVKDFVLKLKSLILSCILGLDFADRDMFVQFVGIGVGHEVQYNSSMIGQHCEYQDDKDDSDIDVNSEEDNGEEDNGEEDDSEEDNGEEDDGEEDNDKIDDNEESASELEEDNLEEDDWEDDDSESDENLYKF